MIISSLLERSVKHRNYNEDAQMSSEIGQDWFIGAVMDGCSTAMDSHFASALVAKLFEKNAKALNKTQVNPTASMGKISPKELGISFLETFFQDIKQTQRQLALDDIELLTTFIILVYNNQTKKAWVNISGDGFIIMNDEIIEVDQNNAPDFFGYHLNESFDTWFKNHTKSYEFEKIMTLAISTDGPAKLLDINRKQAKDIKALEYMLTHSDFSGEKKQLRKKYEFLRTEYQLYPFDDISILKISN